MIMTKKWYKSYLVQTTGIFVEILAAEQKNIKNFQYPLNPLSILWIIYYPI